MLFVVKLEIGDYTAVVDASQIGEAIAGGTSIALLQTETHGVFMMTIGNSQVPVVVWTDGIDAVHVSIRGYTYVARVRDERMFRLFTILEASPAAKSRTTRIAAPMPGLLKTVSTREGAAVRKGESLFTLEAMKMENIIRAPIAGTVRNVASNGGAAVERGAILCEIEPAL